MQLLSTPEQQGIWNVPCDGGTSFHNLTQVLASGAFE